MDNWAGFEENEEISFHGDSCYLTAWEKAQIAALAQIAMESGHEGKKFSRLYNKMIGHYVDEVTAIKWQKIHEERSQAVREFFEDNFKRKQDEQ